MLNIIKKFTILFLIISTQHCSTALTVVDTTTSAAMKTVSGAVKGIVHITTCPFTDKECF